MLRGVKTAAVILATLAVTSLALSGPGTRAGLWHFRTGLALFALSGLIGLLAALAGAIAWQRTRRRSAAVAALAGIAVLIFPVYGFVTARNVPPIHDIATDVADPPKFRAVLAARGTNSNPVGDTIDDVARQQRVAYPELQPIVLPLSPDEAFARVVAAVRGAGWEIVAADSRERIVEATARTSFFGFRDDVVVRVRPADGGSRIDMRSTSRVGRSDAGANAARIRRFLRGLQQD